MIARCINAAKPSTLPYASIFRHQNHEASFHDFRGRLPYKTWRFGVPLSTFDSVNSLLRIGAWQMIQELALGHLPRQEMRRTHAWLEQHFVSLRNARREFGRPVYLIEHSLTPDEIRELTGGVCDALVREPDIGGAWWRDRFLPLLIVATEIGYEYRGNGTDYWPLLETALRVPFEYEQRRYLSDYFATCRGNFNCVDRPDSDWARSFCHIAWPIANSVLPLDMRLPFAEAIGSLSQDVRILSDPELLHLLRRAKVRSWSQRYESWLQTGDIAALLARTFLGLQPQNEYIHESAYQRIRQDLIKDSAAAKALRQARRRQQVIARTPPPSEVKPTRTKGLTAKQNRKSPKLGRLWLRKSGPTSFELLGNLPLPPKTSWRWLERLVRSGRWRPQPWGLVDEPCLTPSEILFSTQFKVPIRTLLANSDERDFFHDWRFHNPDADEADWLESVAFRFRPPLVFIPEDETIACQRLQHFIPHGSIAWILVAKDVATDRLPAGVVVLGSVASLKVCQVDTSFSEATQWLDLIGISAARDLAWSWLTVPSIGTFQTSTYDLGDLLALRIQRVTNYRDLLLDVVTGDGKQISCPIESPGIYRLPTDAPGSLQATLSAGDTLLDSWSCFISEEDLQSSARHLYEITLSGAHATTSALLNRQLTLTISFERPISGFDLEVRFNSGDPPVKRRLHASPAQFRPTHPLWDDLIGDKTRDLCARGGDLVLGVRACGQEERFLRLENEISHLHWDFDDDAPPRATTDDAGIETVCWPLNEILAPSHLVKPEMDVPALWVAMEGDRPRFEDGGLVVSPRKSSLSCLPPRPSRLLRQLHGADGICGIKQIIEMYLCLSNAKTTHIVAAFHCDRVRQLLKGWIVEACCGSQWITTLGAPPDQSPLDTLISLALEHWTGFVPAMHQELLPTETLLSAVREQLAKLLPMRWWRLPTMPFGNNDGERYDAAFATAYKRAADELPSDQAHIAGQWRSVSPFNDVDAWRSVIQRTCEQLNGGTLAELVFPLAGGDFLLNASVEGASLDELADSLMDWRKRFLANHRSSETWTSERFKVCLAIFLQPQLLRKTAWESSVDGLLTDRVSARAVLFLVWRIQQLESLASSENVVGKDGADVST